MQTRVPAHFSASMLGESRWEKLPLRRTSLLPSYPLTDWCRSEYWWATFKRVACACVRSGRRSSTDYFNWTSIKTHLSIFDTAHFRFQRLVKMFMRKYKIWTRQPGRIPTWNGHITIYTSSAEAENVFIIFRPVNAHNWRDKAEIDCELAH